MAMIGPTLPAWRDRWLRPGTALLDIALDIFHHHDGVIDHDADGKHEAEKAERIDGEAEHIHHRERADDGDGNGDQRDDGGAPCLQEQDNDDHHQHDGFKQGMNDRFNRGFHKRRRVIDDVEIHAFRHGFLQVGHGGMDVFGNFKRIGAGCLKHTHANR